jgi:ferredoxin
MIAKFVTMVASLPIAMNGFLRGIKRKSIALARGFGSSPIACVANRPRRPPRRSTILQVNVPHHQKTFDLQWKIGDSLKDLAENNPDLMAEYIEGTCGGHLSCSTCHVYIDQPEFRVLLDEPVEEEKDMLVR